MIVKEYKSKNGGEAYSWQTKPVHSMHSWWLNLTRRLKRHGLESKLMDPSPILDIGCGDGSYLPALLMEHKNKQIYGIDIDRKALLYGKDRYGRGAKLVNGTVDKMPFKDELFMFTFSNLIYDDCIKRFSQERLAKEIFRILKPSGIYVSNSWDPIDEEIFYDQGFNYISLKNSWKDIEDETVFLKP